MGEPSSAFRLDGKVALVTGGAKGLGAAIVATLSEAGATVMVTDILQSAGEEVVARIAALGGKAAFALHDVAEEPHWERVVMQTCERFGRFDILVNNAGIEIPALLPQCSVESFRRTMDVNVTGVFLGLKHAIRVMAPGGTSGRGGSIVNLSSVAGLIGAVAHSAYCASKGAVRLLTKAAAVECGRLNTGVRVNSIHPGVIETDMGSNFIRGFVTLGLAPDVETSAAGILALHPLGRFGEPDDVANAVLYLASDAAKWITGAELSVDGGIAAS